MQLIDVIEEDAPLLQCPCCKSVLTHPYKYNKRMWECRTCYAVFPEEIGEYFKA